MISVVSGCSAFPISEKEEEQCWCSVVLKSYCEFESVVLHVMWNVCEVNLLTTMQVAFVFCRTSNHGAMLVSLQCFMLIFVLGVGACVSFWGYNHGCVGWVCWVGWFVVFQILVGFAWVGLVPWFFVVCVVELFGLLEMVGWLDYRCLCCCLGQLGLIGLAGWLNLCCCNGCVFVRCVCLVLCGVILLWRMRAPILLLLFERDVAALRPAASNNTRWFRWQQSETTKLGTCSQSTHDPPRPSELARRTFRAVVCQVVPTRGTNWFAT